MSFISKNRFLISHDFTKSKKPESLDFVKNSDFSSKTHDYTYFTFAKPSVYDEYHSHYWQFLEKWIIETQAKKNINDLLNRLEDLNEDLQYLSDYYYLCEILNQLKGYDFSNKTFINFIRHFPALNCYLHHQNYKVFVESDSIVFHIWVDEINLILNFNNDYLINFYSYDDDKESINDKLVYSLKGNFSSSSNLRKSHKIERLLSVLMKGNNSHVDLEHKFEHHFPKSRLYTNNSDCIKYIRGNWNNISVED